MMRILVATASRHGATHEIGQQLGTALAADLADRGTDAEVDVRNASDVTTLADYSAVVLGSAVYMGRWLRDARHFVDEHETALQAVPVWLFSSGPVDDANPKPTPAAAPPTPPWAREHRVFPGRLDRSVLGSGERLVAAVVRASDGDHRDPAAVEAWAHEIGAALMPTT